MRAYALLVAVSIASLIPATVSAAAPGGSAADAKIVAEATKGRLKGLKGKVFEKSCNQSLDYDATVVDLNGDGQPEVFTNIHGTCLGGMAGVVMELYIKDKSGQWQPQFGFPGVSTVLKTKNLGYPDIEVGGPGTCFPVWRWNGRSYALFRKCPR